MFVNVAKIGNCFSEEEDVSDDDIDSDDMLSTQTRRPSGKVCSCEICVKV